MGWCGGTKIFDPMVEVILSSESKEEMIRVLIHALENGDWDCHNESEYIDNPIVVKVMKEIHPQWYE